MLQGLVLSCALLPLFLPTAQNLEYEYSILTSLCIWTLLCLCTFVTTIRTKLESELQQMTFVKFILMMLILYVPGITLLIFDVCRCSPAGFIFWLTTNTLSTLTLALGVYNFLGKKKKKFMLLIVLTVAILEVSMLFFFPQKRMHSFLLGYLHGPIYDIDILVPSAILLLRLLVLLLGLFYIFQHKANVFPKYGKAFIPIALIGLMASLYQNKYVGHGNTILKKAFSHKIDAHGNYSIYLNKNSFDPKRLALFEREVAFHYMELKKIIHPRNTPHTKVFLYSNEKEKKLLFGGYQTDITDVVTPSIHITIEQYPHPTLRHELVHAITSDFAFHGLGFHPNMAITEGLALALAPNPRSISLDIGAGSLFHSGRIKNVEQLFSYNFWQYSGARAYTIAGSLISYLVHQFSSEKVFDFYAGKGWLESFGKERSELIQSWKNHLTQSFNPEKHEQFTNRIFQFPGVLHVKCPHSRVDLGKKETTWTERLRQGPFWDPRTDFKSWESDLLKDSQSEQKKKKVVLKREIWKVLKNPSPIPLSAALLADLEATINTLGFIDDFQIALLWVDYLLVHQPASKLKIQTILAKLKESASQKFLGKGMNRAILVREEFVRSDSNVIKSFILYMRNLKPIPSKRLFQNLNSYAFSYLYLRWNKNLDSQELLDSLATLEVFSPPKYISIEWKKLLAYRFMESKHYLKAQTLFDQLSRESLPGEQKFFSQERRFATYLLGIKG